MMRTSDQMRLCGGHKGLSWVTLSLEPVRRVQHGDASLLVHTADELALNLNLIETHALEQRINGHVRRAPLSAGARRLPSWYHCKAEYAAWFDALHEGRRDGATATHYGPSRGRRPSIGSACPSDRLARERNRSRRERLGLSKRDFGLDHFQFCGHDLALGFRPQVDRHDINDQ